MGWGNVDEVQQDSDQEEHVSDNEVGSGNEHEINDEDSDNEQLEVERAHPATTVSEKNRAENEIFRAYACQKTARITDEEIKGVMKNMTDDKLSIRDILAKAENSHQIVNPRDYQTELFQRAKDENIIAVLGTGTGKTHIATLLLRHVLDKELESRAKGYPPKIAFFLVSIICTLGCLVNCVRWIRSISSSSKPTYYDVALTRKLRAYVAPWVQTFGRSRRGTAFSTTTWSLSVPRQFFWTVWGTHLSIWHGAIYSSLMKPTTRRAITRMH